MPKTYRITSEQVAELADARGKNRDKQVEKRLHAVQLRGSGKTNAEIGKQLATSSDVVSRWVSSYARGGIGALLAKPRGGNRRNMSIAEEAALLAPFKELAAAGQIVEVSAIKCAYKVYLPDLQCSAPARLA